MFLISNHEGGYYLENPDFSYQGLYLMKDLELYKFIESITSLGKVKKIKTSTAELEKGKIRFLKTNELIIKTNEELKINLDFRKIHDYSEQGRIYKTTIDNDKLIVNYTKYKDDQLKKTDYKLKLEITGFETASYEENWKKKEYSYDKKRGTKSDFYINHGIKIKPKNELKIKVIGFPSKKVNEEKSDYLNSLKCLTTREGILAGYPWFYQYWARDELISLKPYIKTKPLLVKKILERHLNNIDEQGMVSNRHPKSELGSIDSTGWLFNRYKLFLTENDVYNKNELNKILIKSEETLKKLNKHRNKGLIYNKPLETWMDTNSGESNREGYRVEIQFLYFEIIRFINFIRKKIGKETINESFKEIIKKELVKENILLDGKNDYSVRPNVFIAYYLNPNLIDKETWEKTFDKVINECWLEWGGFSTISKQSSLYKKFHTGINNESYHHGDSWYYINNIAAIAMHDLNKEKYKKYINKIFEASEKDFNEGLINHTSEISDSEKRSSKGSLCQAWSSSTLYELSRFLH